MRAGAGLRVGARRRCSRFGSSRDRSLAGPPVFFGRDVERTRRVHPGLPERDLLVKAVLERHPAWGEELVSQMVLDYPEAADLARVVARMERGFRGFR